VIKVLALLCTLAAGLAVDHGVPDPSRDAPHELQRPKHDRARPVNIVFMLADDQSWDGTSVSMHPELRDSRSRIVQTPNLERLAAEGVRFSAAYAPSPVCSPTRASLVTGLSPATLGWTKAAPVLSAADNPPLLPPSSRRNLLDEEVSIAEVLGAAGYATAHFGKWHLGGGGPEHHGFETSDGNLGNEAAAKFKDPNPVDIFGMAERAGAFMERARDEGRPFFVQLSWHALHAPENALEATKAKYAAAIGRQSRQSDRAALTEDLDTGVGRVLASLERLGLADNTYVIYMSDNGGSDGGRGPLSGGKGSLGEGGLRVPFIVRGPGIEPGSWCDVPIVGFDLFPTYLEWAGVDDGPEALEGTSIASLLTGGPRGGDGSDAALDGREMVFHFPHYQNDASPQSAIYLDGYKLVLFHETGQASLFHISEDPGEATDLSATQPGRAADMERRLLASLAQSNAGMPTANPDYDPSNRTRSEERGRRGGFEDTGRGRRRSDR